MPPTDHRRRYELEQRTSADPGNGWLVIAGAGPTSGPSDTTAVLCGLLELAASLARDSAHRDDPIAFRVLEIDPNDQTIKTIWWAGQAAKP